METVIETLPLVPPPVPSRVGRPPLSRQPRKNRQAGNQTQANTTGNQNAARTKKQSSTVQQLTNQLSQLKTTVSKLRAKDQKVLSENEKLRKLRPQVAKAAEGMIAMPADPAVSFGQTGKSSYLASLLCPDLVGAVSIPDDVVRLHSLRSETVTYNLTVPSTDITGSGVIFLFPNHPTNLIGYHYTQDPANANNYLFNTVMTTAQSLPANYDYARRVSQLLTLQSSTIPSGVYALNGTFNALRMDGTVSELTILNSSLYSGLLAQTTNFHDKVGNVLVGDGLAVLSIPDSFDIPFSRLNDSSPVTYTTPVFGATNVIQDDSDSLDYCFAGNMNGFTLTPGTVATLLNMTANIDSTAGVFAQFNGGFAIGNQTAPLAIEYAVNYTWTALNPFGAVIYNNSKSINVRNSTTTGSPATALNQPLQSFHDITSTTGELIAAINLTITITPFAAAFPAGLSVSAAYYDIVLNAPLGARPGVNTPLVVVAYQGVAAGSVITVSGISNFELIPNPVLRQNLDTFYGPHAPDEMEYVKSVICNRDKFDIRSVWNLKEYRAHQTALLEIADGCCTSGVAKAFGWSDLLNVIKRKALPALKTAASAAFPEFKPLIDLGSNLLSAKSASGYAIGKAASGYSVRPSAMAADRPLNFAYAADRPVYFTLPRRDLQVRPSLSIQQKPDLRLRGVPFPVVLCDADVDSPVGMALYIAVLGNHSSLLPSDHPSVFTKDGYIVYGLKRRNGVNFATTADITLLPISPSALRAGTIQPIDGPYVEGTSCDGALWLANRAVYKTVYPMAVTGEVVVVLGVPMLSPNPVFPVKQSYCHDVGISLAACDPDADYFVRDLTKAYEPSGYTLPKKVSYPTGTKAMAIPAKPKTVANPAAKFAAFSSGLDETPNLTNLFASAHGYDPEPRPYSSYQDYALHCLDVAKRVFGYHSASTQCPVCLLDPCSCRFEDLPDSPSASDHHRSQPLVSSASQ